MGMSDCPGLPLHLMVMASPGAWAGPLGLVVSGQSYFLGKQVAPLAVRPLSRRRDGPTDVSLFVGPRSTRCRMGSFY